MVFNAPLDLQFWLVNTFAGNALIFIIISVIVIMALGARFRMPNSIVLSLFAIFIVIMMGTVLSGATRGIFLLVLIVVGMVTYFAISRIVK